ncbi:MAG: hypothetical protein KC925_02265 [Candidatus Doudnabacteria bacterium]|nr:hypothetical protein [Candidatus Doudnabacteria bacterium]
MLTASHEHAQTVVLTDFDHTLFDAVGFKDLLQVTSCAVLGLDPRVYESAYARIRGEMFRGFSAGAFFEAMALEGAELDEVQQQMYRGVLEDLTRDTSRFVYADVVQFVRTMRTWDAIPVIVSFGDIEFQHLKLHGSGLEAFLPDVRFFEQDGDIKDEMIAKAVADYPEARFAYIDDRGDLIDRAKRAFPDMIAMKIARPGTTYEHTETRLADNIITSFQNLPYLLASCLSCAQGDHDDHSHEDHGHTHDAL